MVITQILLTFFPARAAVRGQLLPTFFHVHRARASPSLLARPAALVAGAPCDPCRRRPLHPPTRPGRASRSAAGPYAVDPCIPPAPATRPAAGRSWRQPPAPPSLPVAGIPSRHPASDLRRCTAEGAAHEGDFRLNPIISTRGDLRPSRSSLPYHRQPVPWLCTASSVPAQRSSSAQLLTASFSA
jgi:hypothetical protein